LPSPTPSQSDEDCRQRGADSALAGSQPLDEKEDLISCRSRREVPRPVVFVAAGDSITSAHNQTGFGLERCAKTKADFRELPGNDGVFSYAFDYFGKNEDVVDYYNFARTGFSTINMLNAKQATTDGCGNEWNRTMSPADLAEKVIRKAKRDGEKAHVVTTGGINNTNWSDVLRELVTCQMLEILSPAAHWGHMFEWIVPRVNNNEPALGLKKNAISQGAVCLGYYVNLIPFQRDIITSVVIPPYDGPGSRAPSAASLRIGADAKQIALKWQQAGADKILWLLYYDIMPAEVNMTMFAPLALGAMHPALRYLLPVPQSWTASLIDPIFTAEVQGYVAKINEELTNNLAATYTLKIDPPLTMSEIQNTMAGGAPHPSAAGHAKIATKVFTALTAR
jgi:hypothetical protein